MILLDTHALVWWVADPARLSARAGRAVKVAARRKELAASAISILEISTLVRRGRLKLGVPSDQWFGALRCLPELVIEPVSGEIARVAGAFGAAVPGDPADRIIAATARVLDAKLITADDGLRSVQAIQSIW